MSKSSTLLAALITGGISLYQHTISPDHGPLRWLFPSGVCRFSPTCSEYMAAAVREQGPRGVVTGLRRLGHCHPWATSV
jgi:uncharacterized protein